MAGRIFPAKTPVFGVAIDAVLGGDLEGNVKL